MTRPACPICRKPCDPTYRPFCSRRCADVDLGRWLVGGYAIEADEDGDEDGGHGGAAVRPDPSTDPGV